MSRNFGIDPCVLAGFRNAKGDAIVYLHTDLQDPPEIIPDLIKKHEEGFDVVHTIRTKRKGESKFRMLVTRIAYLLINILSDIIASLVIYPMLTMVISFPFFKICG